MFYLVSLNFEAHPLSFDSSELKCASFIYFEKKRYISLEKMGIGFFDKITRDKSTS
jgi:hypothetical protein